MSPLRPVQNVPDGASGDTAAPRRLPGRQALIPAETQHFSDLSHGYPLIRHVHSLPFWQERIMAPYRIYPVSAEGSYGVATFIITGGQLRSYGVANFNHIRWPIWIGIRTLILAQRDDPFILAEFEKA